MNGMSLISLFGVTMSLVGISTDLPQRLVRAPSNLTAKEMQTRVGVWNQRCSLQTATCPSGTTTTFNACVTAPPLTFAWCFGTVGCLSCSAAAGTPYRICVAFTGANCYPDSAAVRTCGAQTIAPCVWTGPVVGGACGCGTFVPRGGIIPFTTMACPNSDCTGDGN